MQLGGRRDGGGSDETQADNPRNAGWSTFGLFAEMLFTGLLVTGFGVLIVTFIPAMAAGTSHLRRHLSGESDSVGTFVADFRAALRTLWPLAITMPILAGVLVVNGALVRDGAVPGGRLMMSVMVALAAILLVVSLRAAAMWRPAAADRPTADPHRPTLRIGKSRAVPSSWAAMSGAARRSAGDSAGTILVVVSIGLCALLVWMLLPLLAVAPGLLAFALVAVEQRS